MTLPNRHRIALDMDTAMEDGQWGKLKDFLSDKIPAEHMGVVEDICRRGGDAPEPGEDRKRSTSGASDSAMNRYQRHQADVRDRHRRGLISDAELPGALTYGKVPPAVPETKNVTYDATMFPNAGRLK